MCIVCVQYEKGKLTIPEARNALLEIFLTENVPLQHVDELLYKLADDEADAKYLEFLRET